jgi:bacillopeptidase F (M6 metalloprotease family)
MSRTIRAKSGDQYWATSNYSWETDASTWRRKDKTRATYFHSDCPGRDRTAGQHMKEKTSIRRRSRDRTELQKLAIDDEHDYFDIGKIYKSWAFREYF